MRDRQSLGHRGTGAAARQLGQHRVADGVPVDVVDLLEVVGVDQHDRDRRRRPGAAEQLLAGDEVNGPAVRQVGQWVGQRHLFQEHRLLLELAEGHFEFAGRERADRGMMLDPFEKIVEQLFVAARGAVRPVSLLHRSAGRIPHNEARCGSDPAQRAAKYGGRFA